MKRKFIKFFSLFSAFIFLSTKVAHGQIPSDNDIFTVKDINVAYNSGDLEDSKQIAINNGIIEALAILVKTIAPTEIAPKIYQYHPTNPKNLIDKVTPTYERMTSHSYMGKINITFNEQAVQNILNDLGILYRKERAPRTLVIPVFHDNTENTNWSIENWRAAWENMQENYGLLNLTLIDNNLEYVEYINKDSALIDPLSHFTKILDYYRAQQLIIIDAEQVNKGMEVTLRFLGPNQDTIKYYIIYKNSKEKTTRLYKRLVKTLVEKFDNEWKGIESFPDKIMFTSKATIIINPPKVWTAIRSKLDEISQLHELKILKTGLDSMEIEMYYSLPPYTFSELLRRKGIMTKRKNKKLYLELRN